MGLPSLLNLPFELRHQIYSELLCPSLNESITLYSAPHGRTSALNIHPNILLINKQIYHEAIHLLYSNRYKIELVWPTPLVPHRSPSLPDVFVSHDAQYLESTRDWCYTTEGKLLSTKAKLYPYIFRRLQHIEIETADCAIWNRSYLGPCWSQSGSLVVEMLRYLSRIDVEKEDGELAKVQTLDFKFSVMPNYPLDQYPAKNRECNFSPGKLNAERDLISEQLKTVRSLLAAVGKKRTVSVNAELRSNDGGWLADIDFHSNWCILDSL